MKIKRYYFELTTVALVLLVLVVLSKTSPRTAASPSTKYVPPDVIDPKILWDDPSVQKRTEMVQGKKEQRGFGMGFQMRSNFWVNNEEISLVEYAVDYADTWVALYREGKPETELQIVEVISWGDLPIVSIEALEGVDVGYAVSRSPGRLVVYPEVTSDTQFREYCDFYKKKILGKYPKHPFAPVLSYEYFSGRLDGEPKWNLIDDSCLDFIALSSYPTRVYKDIRELPKDYYQDVADLFPEKDLVFVDVGWSTDSSSEEDRAVFLEHLYSFAKNNPTVKALVYGHLFDPFGNELYYYQGTGLITEDGVEKPSLETWKKLFDSSEEK